MRYVLISNGLVTNWGEAEELPSFPDWPDVTVVASDTAQPGDTYDGAVFGPPPVPIPHRPISRLQFFQRFTAAERQAIFTLARTNAAIEDYLEQARAAEFIDLERPDTRAGVQGLEAVGLIGAGRAAEILG